MKVLTVWQPWASLIAMGAKPYEFRGWRYGAGFVGRRIAIHAGARPMRPAELRLLRRQLNEVPWEVCLDRDLALPVIEMGLAAPDRLPLSAILCTAVLGEPRNGYDVAIEWAIGAPSLLLAGSETRASTRDVRSVNDSDRAEHANYAWPLSEIEQVIPPEPFRGKQGWGEWAGR